jgi:hypothetical protein
MNGWYDGATVAARERMKEFRRQADGARAARTARQDEPAEGAVVRARRLAAASLHRLADALAPRSAPGSEPMRGPSDLGGRPVA